MCLYHFLLFVSEIWANIDIYKSPKLSFNNVATAVSSILRARILKLHFLPLYFITYFFLNQMCLYFFSSIWAWNTNSFRHTCTQTWKLSAQNHQSWLLSSQTMTETAKTAIFFWSKWLLGWNIRRRDAGWKFEMRCGHGDQNSEKHLKIWKLVKQQKCT